VTDVAQVEQIAEQRGGNAEFACEAFSRNAGILSDTEQAALHATRVLVAGCGSVGGAIVEPLVRLGVGGLVLADPDTYDLHNINRQACFLADIGLPKPTVLAERARAISPFVEVHTFTEGVTAENVEEMLDGVTIVFDGIDNATSPWEKYLLHKCAVARRIPVVAGADLGGQPTLYVFDYRRMPRLGYGMVRESDVRSGREFQVTIAMLARKLPRDFLPVVRHMAATGAPWPQITYCADGIGVITTRAVVDLVVGRRLPRVVATDIHMLTRRWSHRAWERARWLPELAQTVRAAKRSDPGPTDAYLAEGASLDTLLRPVVDAVRRAPSRSNSQPWKMRQAGGGVLEIAVDDERRLRARDPRGLYTFASIGCAVEAAASVADIRWTPVDGLRAPGNSPVVGTIEVAELRRDYLVNRGRVGIRQTLRRAFDPGALSRELRVLEGAASVDGAAETHFLDDKRRVKVVGRLTGESVSRNLRDATWIFDTVRWLRGSRREFDWDETGIPIPALGVESWLNLFVRSGKRLPLLFDRLRSPRAVAWIARQNERLVCASGALALVTAPDDDPVNAVDAGRTLMALWLAATRLGLSVHPMSATAEAIEVRADLLDVFGCDPSRQPLCVVRLGRPIGAVRYTTSAPRLPLHRILAPGGETLSPEAQTLQRIAS
jgi:molybdopterin/thiamine biosynthesis adenylyltransferase